MAAVTPSAVYRENVGSLTLHIATFANTVDNGDTWASGIAGIVGCWATNSDAPGTATNIGAGASHSGTSITLYLGEDNSACTVYVLSRS